jgi:hypothetical protein
MTDVSPATTRTAEPDQACVDAVDLARAAAIEDAGPDHVGEHISMGASGDRIVTHLFECLSPAYAGWRWAVTVTRAARSKVVTVSESVLLPGPDSLLAPAWVPWTERVRPGDLKAGDLMPASSDDERLVPAVAIGGDEGLLDWDEGDAWRIGAGLVAGEPDAGQDAGAEAEDGAPQARGARRPDSAIRPARVLSAVGRDDAAVRWYAGDAGPRSALATAAPASCQTCGFMVRLSGPLGRVFGVCANEFAPDDGRVVAVDHGCGAHSDGQLLPVADDAGAIPTVDELGYDMLSPGAAEPETVPEDVLETIDHELG